MVVCLDVCFAQETTAGSAKILIDFLQVCHSSWTGITGPMTSERPIPGVHLSDVCGTHLGARLRRIGRC